MSGRAPEPEAVAPAVGPTPCYHCGLPVPAGVDYSVAILGTARPMCCPGCEAVARAIVAAGLDDFYRHRTARSATGRELVPAFLRQISAYDNPGVQKSFVRSPDVHLREASLILEGITCAACVWLNERHLVRLPGVLGVQINYATRRAHLRWDNRLVQLSGILEAISRIGYLAHPYDPGRQQEVLQAERRRLLRRLGLAGVLGMQVMVLAVALYAGAWYGIEPQFRLFFHWLGLGLTLPVLLYAAQPFYRAAWRDISHLRTGMDVPVSLGITIAFAGSAWVTITGSGGEVYFDSVVMFVFFLLTARYFELTARTRAAEASESLVRMTPAMATRLQARDGGEHEQVVPVAELVAEDRVLIRPGDNVPADGRVLTGRSSVDESLLTGESMPIAKQSGDRLIGGSINVESPLTMQVEKTGEQTRLSAILRLLDRAQAEKPALARLADRVAAWFVAAVLVLAAAVAAYWWQRAGAAWLPVTVSVLVATCPCALSLATPTAVTAATGALTRLGLLVTRGHALETLARASHVIFDKTGTLTVGQPRLVATRIYSDLPADACLHRAAAVEAHSEHPLARALRAVTGPVGNAAVTQVRSTPGGGIRARVDGQTVVVGSPPYIRGQTGLALAPEVLADLQAGGRTVVLLADAQAVHAAFVFGDLVRPEAAETVRALQAQGKTVLLLTGDHEQAARQVGAEVGIEHVHWGLTPEDKLAQVRALQARGAVVAMVGDGVNDAPVLAGAQVSVAMGGATQLAHASADMILLSDRLPHLAAGVTTARRTRAIVRQNMLWAVGYNAVALPAAAMGFVRPWMAALGMSLSSLLVVANALRLVAARSSKADTGSSAAAVAGSDRAHAPISR